MKRIVILLMMILLLLVSGVSTYAQEATPLRVEAATTGELTTAAPTVTYSFTVAESLRMAFVYDVQGDMEVTLVVLGSDQQTVLGGSTGSGNNGVIVKFPAAGTYYVGLSANGGTSATYRLMIDADPPLPINTFVVQSYLVKGVSTTCSENLPTAFFSTTEDLNICFSLALIEQDTDVKVQWWSPSGDMVIEEGGTFTAEDNFATYLSGLVYQDTAFEAGWWQAHIVINGELAHIQWVSVQ